MAILIFCKLENKKNAFHNFILFTILCQIFISGNNIEKLLYQLNLGKVKINSLALTLMFWCI